MGEMADPDLAPVGRNGPGKLGVPQVLPPLAAGELADGVERKIADLETGPAVGGPAPAVVAVVVNVGPENLKLKGVLVPVEH